MQKHEALPPIEMRFTEPEDVKKYGDGWFTYDERDLVMRSARELMLIEHGLGVGLFDVFNGVRARTVLGDTAAAWIAVREQDPELAGEFNDFNPVAMLIEWRAKRGGKAPEPEATPEPPDSSSTPETSDRTDSAISLTLPPEA
jgi:hypothetical protein